MSKIAYIIATDTDLQDWLPLKKNADIWGINEWGRNNKCDFWFSVHEYVFDCRKEGTKNICASSGPFVDKSMWGINKGGTSVLACLEFMKENCEYDQIIIIGCPLSGDYGCRSNVIAWNMFRHHRKNKEFCDKIKATSGKTAAWFGKPVKPRKQVKKQVKKEVKKKVTKKVTKKGE